MNKEQYHLGLRIRSETYEKFRFLANSECRSINQEIIYLMNARVRQYEKDHGEIILTPRKSTFVTTIEEIRNQYLNFFNQLCDYEHSSKQDLPGLIAHAEDEKTMKQHLSTLISIGAASFEGSPDTTAFQIAHCFLEQMAMLNRLADSLEPDIHEDQLLTLADNYLITAGYLLEFTNGLFSLEEEGESL